MAFPLEAVPNFSEGRDRATIDAIGRALGEHARLLDVHADADHNRSVFTLAGQADELVEALVAGIAVRARAHRPARARGRASARRGRGRRARSSASGPRTWSAPEGAALELAVRVGKELGLPVFLYGEPVARARRSSARGGPEELQRRIDAGELAPDFGPARLDPAAGAVLVGARRPLIAFNVNLATDDVEVARAIAAVVRERDGGFPGVRALGLALPSRGIVQVSMNVEDPEAVALHEIVARVRAEADARGVETAGSELVGLLPAGSTAAAARSALGLAELDASRLLEARLLDDA